MGAVRLSNPDIARLMLVSVTDAGSNVGISIFGDNGATLMFIIV